MKIDPNLQSVANVQPGDVHNSKTRGGQEVTGAEGDQGTELDGAATVQVSGAFAQVQQLSAKLQEVPDVRTERIAALKEKIQQGTYKPNLQDVANAMVNDSVGRGGQS